MPAGTIDVQPCTLSTDHTAHTRVTREFRSYRYPRSVMRQADKRVTNKSLKRARLRLSGTGTRDGLSGLRDTSEGRGRGPAARDPHTARDAKIATHDAHARRAGRARRRAPPARTTGAQPTQTDNGPGARTSTHPPCTPTMPPTRITRLSGLAARLHGDWAFWRALSNSQYSPFYTINKIVPDNKSPPLKNKTLTKL